MRLSDQLRAHFKSNKTRWDGRPVEPVKLDGTVAKIEKAKLPLALAFASSVERVS